MMVIRILILAEEAGLDYLPLSCFSYEDMLLCDISLELRALSEYQQDNEITPIKLDYNRPVRFFLQCH